MPCNNDPKDADATHQDGLDQSRDQEAPLGDNDSSCLMAPSPLCHLLESLSSSWAERARLHCESDDALQDTCNESLGH